MFIRNGRGCQNLTIEIWWHLLPLIGPSLPKLSLWDFLFGKLELVFLATYIAEVVFIGPRQGEKSGSSLTRQRRSCKVGLSSYLYIVFIILFLRIYRIYGEIWFYSFMNSALNNSQHLKTANIYSFWQLHLNFHKEAKLNKFGPSLILDFLLKDGYPHIVYLLLLLLLLLFVFSISHVPASLRGIYYILP